MAKIIGRGAPTADTFGILGQEYIDELTGIRYVCTKSTHKTGTRVGEADQQCEWVPNQAGGVSSWNDLTDKPFDENVVNDTLIVDWNTFVPKVVADSSEPGSNGLVKVSDVVPTLDDFVNGGTITYKHWSTGEMVEETYSHDQILDMYDNFGIVTDPINYFIVAPYDNFTVEIAGWATFTFPKKGVYFCGGITASLTINGFNGFATTIIKKIDEKFLPDRIKELEGRVVFDSGLEVYKVFDGTYKFENTIIVRDARSDGGGITIYYPTRYDHLNNDTYTYATHAYWDNGKWRVDIITYQATGASLGEECSEATILFDRPE